MRKSLKAAARAVEEVALPGGGVRWVPWMLTLTYARVGDWERRHVSDCLDLIRKWAVRRGFELSYLWVAELQVRGAVHYHVVLWVPRAFRLPKPDKQGWWKHGMSSTEVARRALPYLMKYATKGGDEVEFPRGLRLCGYGGLKSAGREVRSYLCLPSRIHALGRGFQRWLRVPGTEELPAVWVAESSGEISRSAWEFVRFDREVSAALFQMRCDPDSPAWCALGIVGRDEAGRLWWGRGRGVDALSIVEA